MTASFLPKDIGLDTFVSSYAAALVENAERLTPTPLSLQAQCKQTYLFTPESGPYPLIQKAASYAGEQDSLLEIFASRITSCAHEQRASRSHIFLESINSNPDLHKEALKLEETLFKVESSRAKSMKTLHKARRTSIVAIRYLMSQSKDDSLNKLNFMLSAQNGNLEALAMERTFKPNQADINFAFIEAAKGGHTECMEQLVRAGAQINGCDRFGYTALSYAAFFRRLSAIKYLLKDPSIAVNHLDTAGRTPLMHASNLLKSRDPEVHSANLARREAVCSALRADPRCDETLRDVDGKTALDWYRMQPV